MTEENKDVCFTRNACELKEHKELEDVSSEELGGANAHSSKSGVSHFSAGNDLDAINKVKKLLSYIPQNCEDSPPSLDYEEQDENRPARDPSGQDLLGHVK